MRGLQEVVRDHQLTRSIPEGRFPHEVYAVGAAGRNQGDVLAGLPSLFGGKAKFAEEPWEPVADEASGASFKRSKVDCPACGTNLRREVCVSGRLSGVSIIEVLLCWAS